MDEKRCSKCGKTRPVSEFGNKARTKDGRQHWCKICAYAGTAAWKDLNRERATAGVRAWTVANRERKRAADKTYRAANQDRRRRRYAEDPVYAMVARHRSRVMKALRKAKVGKPARAIALLGCTDQEFVAHLEKQFLPGMSWANRSEWHVDHIRPIISFDLRDESQVSQAFHYTNCQPLWAQDNQIKSAKWQPNQKAA